MFEFIQALDNKTYNYLRDKYGYPESSDESSIEGWILDQDQRKELFSMSKAKIFSFRVFEIPEKYQENIDEFKCDYWDGNFVFDDDNYCFMKEKGSDELIFPGRTHWPGPKEYYFEDEKERMI
jgi:hypothetical protein